MEDNLVHLSTLDDELNESSGMLYINGELWTHNDSGDEAKIYRIPETDSSIDERVNIESATHKDWEDIAQDDTHVYIGDFGNNSGKRQDLVIYKVPKAPLPEDVEAETIRFVFPDQLSFNNSNNMHNFDCEAMVLVDNKLYLFSKNHVDQKTKLYQLPTDPGVYTARLLTTFDSDGLITGAGIDKTTNTLCLLGYTISGVNFNPFVWIFYDFEGANFFDHKMKRVNLPILAQTEGICFKNDGQFLISSEDESGTEATLYLFDAAKWKE